MERCKYCGAGYEHQKNSITRFKCGSHYDEGLSPIWVRPLKCYQDENDLLTERIALLSQRVEHLQAKIDDNQTEKSALIMVSEANLKVKSLEDDLRRIRSWADHLESKVIELMKEAKP